MTPVPNDVLKELNTALDQEAEEYQEVLLEALLQRTSLREYAQKRWPAGSSKGGQFAPKDVAGGGTKEVGTFVEVDGGANSAAVRQLEEKQGSLSKAETFAVEEYSINPDGINGPLRRGKNPSKTKAAEAENIRAAIDRNPIPSDVVVYRGIENRAVKKAFGSELRVGDTISDKAFTSTSFSRGGAMDYLGDGGVVAVIKVPKGTKALSLGSDYGQGELLLQRGNKFKVLGARRGEIHLEVIQ